MELKQRKYLLFAITSIFVGGIIYSSILYFVQSISTLPFEFSYTSIMIVISLILGYFGLLVIIKPFIASCSVWTENEHILKIIAITTSFLTVVAMTSLLDTSVLEIGNNDKGILFEIVGFFIYLTPISKYMIKLIKSKNEFKVDHSIIIKTTAISFVLIGLFLQFSFLTL